MVKCKNCGELLDEPINTPFDQRKPCPSCGSEARLYAMELGEEIALHDRLKLKARHGQPGEIRPFLEVQIGDDLFRDTGEWNRREKIEDRENDRYMEHIVNPRTGEVIHHCEEPLSEHHGDGSDRRMEHDKEEDA